MKAHLISFFCRLSLIALLVCGSGVNVAGHDLPHARNLPPAASANCFSSTSYQALPFSDIASPWLHALQSLWSGAGQSASALTAVAHNLSSHLAVQSLLAADELLIQAPDHGFAPRPRNKRFTPAADVGRRIDSPASKSADGLLILAPVQGHPPRPRTNRVTAPANRVAQFLQQLEVVQCQISQALFDTNALQAAIADRTQSSVRLLDQSLAHLRPVRQAAPALAAPSAGPQFVVFNTAAGGHILLTVAQTQEWQFTHSAAEFSAVKSSAASWLSSAIEPLHQQAIAILSEQLEFAGSTLLQLSRSVSNLAPNDVAALPGSKHWK